VKLHALKAGLAGHLPVNGFNPTPTIGQNA